MGRGKGGLWKEGWVPGILGGPGGFTCELKWEGWEIVTLPGKPQSTLF